MYLLDTNTVSEMRKAKSRRADVGVQRWIDEADLSLLYVSAITILEMEVGILLKMRKDAAQGQVLNYWLHGQVLPTFAGRILHVNTAIALRCAPMHVPVSTSRYDSLIAATALVHGMTVVTRNVKDFAPMGVKVLNPWEG
jgi:predicted nucleic acid-binding protein